MAGNDEAASIQACAMRATRLSENGQIAYGQTALIVTNSIIKMDLSAVLEDGEEFTIKSGCGNIDYQYNEGSKLKRMDGELSITNPDVELHEMLTGGTLITAGGQSIGYAAPEVGRAATHGVCLELWSKAWVGGGAPPGVEFADGETTTGDATVQSATANFTSADVGRTISGAGIPVGATILSINSATSVEISANATATATGVTLTVGRPGLWWRWVFPRFVGSLGDFALENAPKENVFPGPCFENRNIGRGPAVDFPAGAPCWRTFSFFRDSALPDLSEIGYQELTA